VGWTPDPMMREVNVFDEELVELPTSQEEIEG
jgi:hypothetical protein